MSTDDIPVRCPHCQAQYSVAAPDLGGSADCESCGKSFTLARAESAAAGPDTTALEGVQRRWEGSISSEAAPEVTIRESRPEHVAPVAAETGLPRKLSVAGNVFVLLDLLGQGGMGLVYRARQNSVDRQIAIKVIRPELAQQPGLRDQFLIEAVVTGDLDHPNVIPIHDVGVAPDGTLFYAMKEVRGTPWNKAIASRSLEENIEILLKVADAVAYAHSKGVVHRDLKPENVMLGDYGEVLVMDWGLAVSVSDTGKAERLMTAAGAAGTPAYLSPEMALGQGDRIGPASDIFLLGGILYECVTGLRPHAGKGAMACLIAAARNEIQPTDKKGELVRIALKAMATEPEDRYPDVKAFQQALRDYRRHAESIVLVTKAKEHLARALQGQGGAVYGEFNEAIAGCRQALALWAGNVPAVKGLRRARELLAQRALERGDLALARSEVDAIRAECREFAADGAALPPPTDLAASVRTAVELAARREHVGRLSRITAVAAGCIVVVVSVTAYLVTRRQRDRAVAAEAAEATQRQAAEAAKAQTELALADTRRENYANVIALADRKIAAGEIVQAEEMLWNTPKELRGWEWGRSLYLCHQELLTLRGHVHEVRSVAFSPDGTRLVSTDLGTVRVWDVITGQECLSMQGARNTLCAVFSPDGKRVATGHWEGTVVLWDATSGAKIQTLSGHKTSVWAIAFSPEGSRLASAERDEPVLVQDCEVFVWDATTGQRLTALKGHRTGVNSVGFSPDGQRLVTASMDGTVRIWEAGRGKELLAIRIPPPYNHKAVFSPDSATVCIGAGLGGVGMWDAMTGERRVTFSGHTGSVNSVALSADGGRAFTAGFDSTARLWDAKTGKELLCIRAQAPVASAVLAPNGRLVATGGTDGAIRLWDATREMSTVALAGSPAGFAAGHPTVVTAGWGSIRLWDAGTGRPLREVGQIGPASACALSTDGLRLITGHEDGKAVVWDVQTGSRLFGLAGHTERVWSVAFSPDGTRVVSCAGHYAKGAEANTVCVWDAASGQRLCAVKGHEGIVWSARFSPDSQRIVTGGHDSTARIWDAASGREQAVFRPTQRSGVMAAAFSPDGRRIVTGHYSNAVAIWDVASGLQLRVLNGHTSPLVSVAFSPDGRRIFTTARGGSPRVWDAETGRELLALQCPDGYSLAHVSGDGRSLALGAPDVTLVLNSLDGGLCREDIGPWKLATYKTWLQESGMATAPAGK